jgi:hypothetical protein
MKKHSQIILLGFCICALLLNLNCKKDNPITPPDNTFALTVDDASCTEVYLSLKIGAAITSRTVILKRDTITLFTKTIEATETTITDTSLLPGHTYIYTASLLNSSTASSSTAWTMDTTSHNIVWDTPVLLGDASSVLNDVAIINDTCIWAVGEIYSGGSICNFTKWSRQQWDTMRISVKLTYTSSQIVTDQDPLKTIYAFNENDIWVVSNAGGVSHWNGSQWAMLNIPFNQGPGACNKMWGTSSSDMHFVGNNGRIIRYAGSSWTKIESGTTLPFQDIWGNGGDVLAVASDKFGLGGKYLVQLSGSSATQLSTNIPTAISFSSVWFVPNRKYYLVGNGIYTKRLLSDSVWKYDPIANQIVNYQYSVRGTGLNDVIVVCEHGTIAHFNGVSWRIYSYGGQTSGDRLLSVCIKNNLIIAVGMRYIDGFHDQALICIGRR